MTSQTLPQAIAAAHLPLPKRWARSFVIVLALTATALLAAFSIPMVIQNQQVRADLNDVFRAAKLPAPTICPTAWRPAARCLDPGQAVTGTNVRTLAEVAESLIGSASQPVDVWRRTGYVTKVELAALIRASALNAASVSMSAAPNKKGLTADNFETLKDISDTVHGRGFFVEQMQRAESAMAMLPGVTPMSNAPVDNDLSAVSEARYGLGRLPPPGLPPLPAKAVSAKVFN